MRRERYGMMPRLHLFVFHAFQNVPDVGQQCFFLGRRGSWGRSRWKGLFLPLQFVHELDGYENRECDDEKVYRRLDEIAVIKRDGFGQFARDGVYGRFLYDNVQILEIHAADEHAQWRHDDVIYKRGHNLPESAANDDADRHVDHVSFQCECFEFI